MRNELFLRFLYLISIYSFRRVTRLNVTPVNLSDVVPLLAVSVLATARVPSA